VLQEDQAEANRLVCRSESQSQYALKNLAEGLKVIDNHLAEQRIPEEAKKESLDWMGQDYRHRHQTWE